MFKCLLIATGVLFWGGAAKAQSADDWDFVHEAERNITVASVTYQHLGVGITCREGALGVLVTGLPPADGLRRILYSMEGEDERETRWVSVAGGGAAFSLWPTYMARRMREGGRISLGFRDGETVRRLEAHLPKSEAAVGRVFEACGRELSMADDAPTTEALTGLEWARPPQIEFPAESEFSAGVAALECTVKASGHLDNCRIESEFPGGSGFGRAALRGAMSRGRVRSVEPNISIEGRKIAFVSTYRLAAEGELPASSRIMRRPLIEQGQTSY